MKKHTLPRLAAFIAAAGMAVAIAGCGSGLLGDTDQDESYYVKYITATGSGLTGNYGMKGIDRRLTITVSNGNFSREFMQRVNTARDDNPIDVTDYFTVTTGSKARLLTGYSFTAVSPVTNTVASVGTGITRDSGTLTVVLSYTIDGSDELRDSGTSSGTTTINASPDALGEENGMVCISDIGYSFSAPSHAFNAPTGSALYWAAATIKSKSLTGLNAATLLTTSYPLETGASAGDVIGTTDSGATVYAAKSFEKKEGSIYAIVHSDSSDDHYTGAVTITLNSGFTHANEPGGGVFSTDDATETLWVPYYGLDFNEANVVMDGTTTRNDVSYGPYVQPSLVDDGEGGFALCEDGTSAAGWRGGFTINTDSATATDDPVHWKVNYANAKTYVVEFA